MVRSRAWWSRLDSNAVRASDSIALDLLDGSGLAVAGATVQRVIGRIDARYTPEFTLGFTGLNVAVIVATTPDPATFTFSGGGDHLYMGRFVGREAVPAQPGLYTTEQLGTIPAFDVAGQRILLSGESVWAIAVISNADTASPIRFTWSLRALVLGPDV